MAGKVFKAGIRFNSENFKYISFIFDEDRTICTIDVDVIDPRSGEALTIRGTINQFVPVEEDASIDPQLSVQATRATKTTKKTAKESK